MHTGKLMLLRQGLMYSFVGYNLWYGVSSKVSLWVRILQNS